MIIEQSITHLTDIWQQRLVPYNNDHSDYANGYKDALLECINDLLELTFPIGRGFYYPLPPEEVQYYLESQEADNYLSSLEAHDIAV